VATGHSPDALAAAAAVIPEVGALKVTPEDEKLRVDWRHDADG
jgi:hypothetical protein